MEINILGTTYQISQRTYDEEQIFKERSIDGYCDDISKLVCVCKMSTHPNFRNEPESYCKKVEKQVLRHEIIHAFLSESGLQESSGIISNVGWAKNEEMIDWLAIQFPKIKNAFVEAECL